MEVLAITMQAISGAITLALRGELDLLTTPTLEQELREAEEFYDHIVLDLRDLSFVDVIGLHALVMGQQRMQERGTKLSLVGADRQVRRLFELIGHSDALEPSAGHARQDVRPARARGTGTRRTRSRPRKRIGPSHAATEPGVTPSRDWSSTARARPLSVAG